MKRCASLLLTLSIPLQTYGSTFRILGVRPMGMGGAQVAIADGPSAQYWNPGALAMSSGSGVEIPIGASFEATGDILQKADSISSIGSQISAIKTAQTNGSSLSLSQVKDFNDAINRLTALNQGGTGVLVGLGGGADVRVSHWALSVNNLTEVGATPFVDSQFGLGNVSGSGAVTLSGSSSLSDSANTTARDQMVTVLDNMSTSFGLTLPSGVTSTTAANSLINDAATSGLTTSQISDIASQAATYSNDLVSSGVSGNSTALSSNASAVTLRGASLTEAALGYGHRIPGIPTRFGELGVGGNIKLIRGEVGYKNILVVNGEATGVGDSVSDFSKNRKASVRPALDLGVLWRGPWEKRPFQAGLLMRNANSPSFDQPSVGVTAGEPDYKENAQVRVGIAYWPLKRLALASDLDLTHNRTSIPGYSSRTWGLGAEYQLWFLALRAGILKNIATNSPVSYTAGVGLAIFALRLDLGGVLSSQTVKINSTGETIPSNLQVGMTLGLVFGGR